MAQASRKLHPVEHYVRDVLKHPERYGRKVVMACERYRRDVETGHERGLWFHDEEAQDAIDFFPMWLKHTADSPMAKTGDPFELRPWQQFIVWNLFGWKFEDGSRRFRIAYIEVPKKNGKSTFAAGIGIYLFIFDGEHKAQIYSSAMSQEQAKIIWGWAKDMIEANPYLKKMVWCGESSMTFSAMNSVFKPLSKEKKTVDGFSPSANLIDEFHRHPTRAYYATIQESTAARRQPLTLITTTAGDELVSPCKQEHDYCVSILENKATDHAADREFVFISDAEPDDDIHDPKTWFKANPNLGVSKFLDFMESAAGKAKQLPTEETDFRRYHLCQWVQQAKRWVTEELWDGGNEPFDESELYGRDCFGGLDLARKNDLSALVLIFPPAVKGERVKIVRRFWCPESDIKTRSERDRVPYDVWVRQGLIQTTPGNITDFDFIHEEITGEAKGSGGLVEKFNLLQIHYDRMFSYELVTKLSDSGVLMLPCGQGYTDMQEPTSYVERLLLAEQLQHGGCPVMKWMAMNVVMRKTKMGLHLPDKDQSREKIDGIVALIMACKGLMDGPAEDTDSVYEKRGLIAF